MKLFSILALSVILSGCAGNDGLDGAPGPKGPTGPTAPPVIVPMPSALDVVVAEYNEQRAAVGQELIQQGLACTLYTVPNSTTAITGAVLTTVGTWGYAGNFNFANGNSSPGLGLLPSTLQSIYSSYYIVKCSGLFIVAASGFYGFDLSSDDGAIVALNGAFLTNDGVHAVSTVSGAKYLARGVYSFSLSYLDIGGSHALMFKSGGVAVSAEHFYH